MTKQKRSSFGSAPVGKALSTSFDLTDTLIVLKDQYRFKKGETVTVIRRSYHLLVCSNGHVSQALLPKHLSLPHYPAAQRLIGAQHVICK